MGRKSREKRTARAVPRPSDRPRWAGAPGFDRSYFIADLYASTRDRLRAAQESHNRYEEARTQIDLARFQLDVLYRQVAAEYRAFVDGLTAALNAHGVPAMPSWRDAIDYLAAHGGTP